MEISLSISMLLAAFGVAALAGVVKGIVGFAMPMVLVSGLGSFLPPEWALAGLILPTLVTNGFQAFRYGLMAALESVKRFRVFLLTGMVVLLASAQLVLAIPPKVFFLLLGVPVTAYALATLLGAPIKLQSRSPRVSAVMGGVAGAFGGISGVWGPITVAYLTAYDLSKDDQMRVQGAMYGLGAVLLLGSHLASGVLTRETMPFSALLVIPAVAGLWVGFKIQDRMDQARFRTATLVVLAFAGLNLVRRGLGF